MIYSTKTILFIPSFTPCAYLSCATDTKVFAIAGLDGRAIGRCICKSMA